MDELGDSFGDIRLGGMSGQRTNAEACVFFDALVVYVQTVAERSGSVADFYERLAEPHGVELVISS